MQIESRRPEATAVGLDGDPEFVAAGVAATGEYVCAGCGYGVAVRTVLPECPMCRGAEWERPSTSPYRRGRL